MKIEITIKIDGVEMEKRNKITSSFVEPLSIGDYARIFDDACVGWERNPEYNLIYLKAQEKYANELLKRNGYLFLNEVYDLLSMPRSKAGAVVGWVYDGNESNVDFGLYNHRNTQFINGYENNILLDFNVDGIILDKIL